MSTEPGVLQVGQSPPVLQEQVRGRHDVRRGQIYIFPFPVSIYLLNVQVKVPEEHLDVCRVCNAFGQNCGVVGPGEAGTGIIGADFVFYISAMETERCQKGMTVAYAAHCQQEAALDR